MGKLRDDSFGAATIWREINKYLLCCQYVGRIAQDYRSKQ
jgi:hypothetical protein